MRSSSPSYDAAPVLAVDTEHLDPAGREADMLRLVDRLEHFHGPREVFGTTGVAELDVPWSTSVPPPR